MKNLERALEALKEKYQIEYVINKNHFLVEKNGNTLTSGHITADEKVEVYDELAQRYKVIKSYDKILEILDWNIYTKLNEIERNQKIEELKEKIRNIDYIIENYNIYRDTRGFILLPKDISKVFSIKVEYWLDSGIKTSINFKKDIDFDYLDKITKATEEFKKVTDLIKN